MDGIVYPATTLLHANATPLCLRQQALGLGQQRLDVFGQEHVPGDVYRRCCIINDPNSDVQAVCCLLLATQSTNVLKDLTRQRASGVSALPLPLYHTRVLTCTRTHHHSIFRCIEFGWLASCDVFCDAPRDTTCVDGYVRDYLRVWLTTVSRMYKNQICFEQLYIRAQEIHVTIDGEVLSSVLLTPVRAEPRPSFSSARK